MALSKVADGQAAANTISLASVGITTGDIVLIHAYRNGSTTAPTIPGTWTPVASSGGANTNSRAIGYRVIAGGDNLATIVGTWTNATAIQFIGLRGQRVTSPIGGSASGGTNTSTLTTPAVSMTDTAGTSWVVAFAGSKSTNANTVTLSSTTDEGSSVGALNLATGRDITSYAQRNYSATVNASANRMDAVEVRYEPPPNANGSFAATGGGVAVVSGTTDRLRGVTATGGGVAATAATTDRGGGFAATGGGVATITGEAEFGENHDGSFAVTGGGAVAVGSTTDRNAALTATGGGAVATAGTTERLAVLTATGAGASQIGATTERSGVISATGGGAVSVSAESARLAAAAMSGGGVLTLAQATERFGAFGATGGGSVQVTGTTGEDHPGAFAVTGGGAVAVEGTTDRNAVWQVSGAGVFLAAILTARNGGFAATGGGRVTFTGTGGDSEPPEFVDVGGGATNSGLVTATMRETGQYGAEVDDA